jgi:hypothetical protein
MVFIFQMYLLFTAVTTEKSMVIIIGLSAPSIVLFIVFLIASGIIGSIMKIVEFAVGVTCKKYLTEKRVPDLGMKPVPNEQIDDRKDDLVDAMVTLIRKEEGLIKTVLTRAAHWKASAIVEDLKTFQVRNEYEQVKEKELVHFMAECQSKELAEKLCGLVILVAYLSAFEIIGSALISAYILWF